MTGREIQKLTGIKDVYEYVRRLNRAVSQAAGEQRGRPCLLVQRIASGRGLDDDVWVLVAKRAIVE